MKMRSYAHILRDEFFIKTKGNEIIADIRFVGVGNIKAFLTDCEDNEIAAFSAVGDGHALFADDGYEYPADFSQPLYIRIKSNKTDGLESLRNRRF